MPRPGVTLARPLAIALGAAGIVVALAGLHAISSLFGPIFLALTLVICVHPVLRALIRRGWPAWIAATVCIAILYIIVLVLIVATALSIAKFAEQIVQDAQQSQDLVNSVTNLLDRVGLSSDQAQAALSKINLSQVFSVATSLLSSIGNSLTAVALFLAVTLFMVSDAITWPQRSAAVAAHHPQISTALDGFAVGVRKYWLVATVFGLIVAVFDTAALYLLSVPLALVWGLLSFLTNYIPNIGFVLGVIPPALLALINHGIGSAIAVVVVYSVLNVVIQTVIQPRFTGDAVGLNVTSSFISLVAWGFLLGPLGALIALPMSMFVKSIVIDADPRLSWVNAFIESKPKRSRSGSPPGPEPTERPEPG